MFKIGPVVIGDSLPVGPIRLCALLVLVGCSLETTASSSRQQATETAVAPALMSASALADFPNPPADHRAQYGEGALQFGELRLPQGEGPHPVLVLLHGGCWLAAYDIAQIRKLAAAFAEAGIATWSLEYRRVGDEGGGWPGTFDDVAAGFEYLSTLAESFPLDLDRVVSAGHSAGGHLALWLANRPPEWPSDLRPKAVLALAPAADLAFLDQREVCGDVVDRLMGGSPEEVPLHYKQGSISERLPLGVPQYLVIGQHDRSWREVGERYARQAVAAGDAVHVDLAEDSGHFEMIDPDSRTWPTVLNAARRAFAAAQ